jgi:hypothetical protein
MTEKEAEIAEALRVRCPQPLSMSALSDLVRFSQVQHERSMELIALYRQQSELEVGYRCGGAGPLLTSCVCVCVGAAPGTGAAGQ